MSHTSTILLVLALTFIGFTANATTYSDKQLNCLAQNIYHESRGEPYAGQLAVAFVTLNRVEDPNFPSDICKVVYQRGQFSWTNKNARVKEKDAWLKSVTIAKLATALHEAGADNTNGALYFDGGGNKVTHRNNKTARIGKHSFYQ